MKRTWLGLILAAVGLLAIPAVAGAAEYETYVGCSSSASATPSHECQLGDTPGAFFEADEDTFYEVCVEFPNGEYLCSEEEFAEEGILYVNEIFSELPGLHFVDWWVGGELISFWDFNLNAPSPPPPPPPPAPPAPPAAPPVVVPPTAVTPQVSAACVKAKAKVQKFRNQLRKAVLPKQKARIRGKLNRARGAVRRLC